MSQLDPIVNAGLLYVNNMQVAYATATTLTMAAGQCRDSNNVMDIVLSTGVTINAAVNGINGLDTGSLANNTFYYVYAIASSTNKYAVGAIISASKTAPTLPLGYDSYRLIDAQLTDGSAHFLLSYNSGNGNVRNKFYDAQIVVVNAGTSSTLAAVDCATAIPPLAQTIIAKFNILFTPAVAGQAVALAFNGSSAVSNYVASGVVASVQQIVQAQFPTAISTGTQKCQYINSAVSCSTTIQVAGYQFYI